jgi:hypothetical protein
MAIYLLFHIIGSKSTLLLPGSLFSSRGFDCPKSNICRFDCPKSNICRYPIENKSFALTNAIQIIMVQHLLRNTCKGLKNKGKRRI